MSPTKYAEAMQDLKINHAGMAKLLCATREQSHAWASGKEIMPTITARYLEIILYMGLTIKTVEGIVDMPHVARADRYTVPNRLLRYMAKKQDRVTFRELQRAINGDAKGDELRGIIDTLLGDGRIAIVPRTACDRGRIPNGGYYKIVSPN